MKGREGGHAYRTVVYIAHRTRIWPVCVYVLFLFTRRRKGDPIKERKDSLITAKSRGRDEERERARERARERKGNARGGRRRRFLETASIFKLARSCAGARRGWQGNERREGRGCSSDPFRICPIENLSDVHGVSSSRHFYRRARRPPSLYSSFSPRLCSFIF